MKLDFELYKTNEDNGVAAWVETHGFTVEVTADDVIRPRTLTTYGEIQQPTINNIKDLYEWLQEAKDLVQESYYKGEEVTDRYACLESFEELVMAQPDTMVA